MIHIHCPQFYTTKFIISLGDYAYQQFFLRFPILTTKLKAPSHNMLQLNQQTQLKHCMHFSMHHTYQCQTLKNLLLKSSLLKIIALFFIRHLDNIPPHMPYLWHQIFLNSSTNSCAFSFPKQHKEIENKHATIPSTHMFTIVFLLLEASAKEKKTIILKTHFLFLKVNVANFNIKHFTPQLDDNSSFHGDISFHIILNYKMIGEIDI